MVRSIKLLTCIGLKYDTELIDHFCNHYSKFDIHSYHIILHNDVDFNLADYFKHFLKLKPRSIIFESWVGEFNCIDKIDKFNKIIKETEESHILLTDVDEFQNHTFPVEFDYIWGDLTDREPVGSKTKKVTSDDITVQFPIKTKVSGWNNTVKPCIFPSTERLISSHFISKNYDNQDLIEIDHYRWTDSRLLKSKERYKIHSRLNRNNITFPGGYPVDTRDSENVISRLKNKTLI